jgi:hypothetical protein
MVKWQGARYRLTGTLDAEEVTDEIVFREVGLLRQATAHEIRAEGTVQRAALADLRSGVEVP